MKDIYFKSMLVDIEKRENIPIVCKIYCFNNIYFAKEICTGAVFPILNSRDLLTLDNETISIRENFISGLHIVIPKCIKQDHTRRLNSYDIYDINSYVYNKNKYKSFFDITKNLNDFDIDDVKKGTEKVCFNDDDFNLEKYLITMSKNLDYISYILEAQIKNNKILEDIGVYINKVEFNDINNTLIPFNKDKENSSFNYEGLNYDGSTKKKNINLKEIKNYGYDLSEKSNFTELIDRDDELKRIIKNICIKGTSTILIGESGCGKTAIVEELARLSKTDNKWLTDKTIFSLNTNSLISGTKYRGDFEKKIQEVIDFCIDNNKNIILFIDEIHTLKGLGASAEDSNDAMNILKPYISDGRLTIIGATTKKEYENFLTEDEAFLRRLEKIDISKLETKTLVEILLNYNKKLEKKYKIKFNINEDILKEIFTLIVELTDIKHQRIVGDIAISNPTLSKYLLEDAYADCIYEGKEEVTIKELATAIKSCDKVSPTKKEELANLLLEEYKEIKYIDEDKEKKDKNVIKLSFN